ncbi:hypothetical protein [Sulfuracidifex metallicus]|uniref:hypothetical protein n=1 Tax=Sulfuracidifex metallicus TaxID=47303 RepID=UPI0022755D5C|nr:hypothetical protein [Sulfuracidifex metallicus]MCY0851047.1 hypothetical protein [Sulfuracidifex metallicus]MCY0851085.1 hypothetical protein [Sulfuracidifex metallicus]
MKVDLDQIEKLEKLVEGKGEVLIYETTNIAKVRLILGLILQRGEEWTEKFKKMQVFLYKEFSEYRLDFRFNGDKNDHIRICEGDLKLAPFWNLVVTLYESYGSSSQ